jgi:AraC-like DNA-binding protein
MWERLVELARDPDWRASFRIPLVVYNLLHELMEISSSESPTSPAGLRAARQSIDDQLQDPVDAERLAALAGLSRFHFIRAFKKEFGCSPVQYQIGQRMAVAKTLLMAGMSVKETAYRVGYEDLCYFSRVFKAKTGIAPSLYHDQRREGERALSRRREYLNRNLLAGQQAPPTHS